MKRWLFFNFLAGKTLTAIDIEMHLINSIYVIINVCVTGMPVRLLHVWFSVLFALVYSLFSLFYFLAGGTNHNGNPYIYPAIDWRNAGSTALYCVIVTFVEVPVIQSVLFGLHKLKVTCSRRCCSAENSAERKWSPNQTQENEKKIEYPLVWRQKKTWR